LVKGGNQILEVTQVSGFANACDFILQTIGKSSVVTAGQSGIIPTCAAGIMVEIKSIAGRSCGVMVLEGLERGGSIVLWIAGTKKAAELFQKFREGVKPQRKATAMSYSMIQLGLEPIERHITQIRENE
jgi:hypothetical protein